MKRFFQYLFPRRTIVVDADKFGPRLDWQKFQSILRHQGDTQLFQALGQLLLAQREICHGAVADKSNLTHGQTAYEAGAAGCAGDLIGLLDELERGKCSDQKLREWFGEPAKAEK